jgi:FAD/FMN-containing dehydrogenase
MSPIRRSSYRSWGRTDSVDHWVERPSDRTAAAAAVAASDAMPALAVGCARSYGDVGLNPGGRLIDCRSLDRFISFDAEKGILVCEAGVQLAEILAVVCRPAADGLAWFLPVTPGTRCVTVGGAIANDVHGKNHHRCGAFGRHVVAFELARTDGSRRTCSPTENSELFAATIGGMGLTGVILTATLQLRRVPGLALEAEDIRFQNLDEFFAITEQSDREWEYTAAWIDCQAGGAALGRGIFSRANHVAGGTMPASVRAPRLSVPFVPPLSLMNRLTARGFNALYWRKPGGARSHRVGYASVLYPLDAIGNWNRLYGPAGFFQFQCVLPPAAMRATGADILKTVADSGEPTTLAVLKMFGDAPSPGLMSFPAPGATLALDFPNRGATTRQLLGRLEQLVADANGRLYPAKDRLMSAETYRRGYPRIDAFRPWIDRGIRSGFAQRVALVPASES